MKRDKYKKKTVKKSNKTNIIQKKNFNLFDFSYETALELGRTKKNVLHMLIDRGYNIGEEKKILEFSNLQAFCYCYNHKKLFFQVYNDKLCVHFILNSNKKKKISLQDIKNVLENINTKIQCIFIIPDKLSHEANNQIKKTKIQVLNYDFFVFPLSKHWYVPLHTKLSDNEKKNFLLHRKITEDQLPVLKNSDPIVQYYGWRPGSLIKITRPCYFFYRVVK